MNIETVDKLKLQELLKDLRASGCDSVADELEREAASKLVTNKWLDQLITQDERMLKLKEDVLKLIPHEDCVLIRGETGTGKELIARALHGSRKGPFMAINCAGMPDTLIESELFGHAKGSFTGAEKTKIGLMELAENGTLFLDEIGELNMPTQAKLLRVIQERSVRRVGGDQEIKINCRIVSATHRELSHSEFRKDLYYRISTFELVTIPLHDRWQDISLIVAALDVDKKIPSIEIFCNFPYRKLEGNVRQLQQLVRRFYVLGEMPVSFFTQKGKPL